MDISGKECARARESASADLDRELPELDNRRLQAHLRVCADCSAWAGRVRATTAHLREASFEATPAFGIEIPRRSRAWRVAPVLVVAPAAALAASVVFSLGVAHGFLGGQRATTTRLGPTRSNRVHNSPGSDVDGLPVLRGTLRAV